MGAYTDLTVAQLTQSPSLNLCLRLEQCQERSHALIKEHTTSLCLLSGPQAAAPRQTTLEDPGPRSVSSPPLPPDPTPNTRPPPPPSLPYHLGLWLRAGTRVPKDMHQAHRCSSQRGRAPQPSVSGVQKCPSWAFSSIQFSSFVQSCLTLGVPMNRSMPGLPVHHQLPEFTQTHDHRVRDAIQPSHPLSSPFPPAPNPCQHQSLFQ